LFISATKCEKEETRIKRFVRSRNGSSSSSNPGPASTTASTTTTGHVGCQEEENGLELRRLVDETRDVISSRHSGHDAGDGDDDVEDGSEE